MEKQKLPKWYYDLELDYDSYKSSEVVKNYHTHKKCTLTPEELAMYDLINGMQMMAESVGFFSPQAQEPNNIKNKGLQWFRETNPEAYEILFPNL